ncbi:Carbohydrate sulfotransferase 15 [Holothuria leucospilota]|uniref:Carbohydrate sulfotransferase 15 n=1 Tax=Holothuria leucospilota TaxID=206669 RepID=A0A9Q1HHV1_HOLLE|nr:Carbohydrate sulfotransferase 15 [Holothuria leucospilota]
MWESFYPEYHKVGPPYVTADVIQAILPNAKLLVSFRDPTARLFSGYVYFNLKREKTASAKAFHDKVVSELSWFKTCTSNRSIRACAYSARDGVRIHVGLYSVYTKDWLERFPPDQLMFLKLEEWGSNCTGILPKIYKFLEVSTLTSSRIQEICSWKTRNANAKNLEAVGPMLNKTRDLLRKFYRPFVKELADMLNDTRFLWDYLDS